MNIEDIKFVETEVNRINAEVMLGEQAAMIQSDMKRFAVSNDMWPTSVYKDLINAHAEYRGWLQEGFTGMEIMQ